MKHLNDRYLGSDIDYEIMIRELYKTSEERQLRYKRSRNNNRRKITMKKIMFNDKYGLTDAVLNGTKTQTRRIIKPQPIYDEKVGMIWKEAMSGRGVSDFEEPQASYRNFVHNSKYKVGEMVKY